jgi:hypothetical protein
LPEPIKLPCIIITLPSGIISTLHTSKHVRQAFSKEFDRHPRVNMAAWLPEHHAAHCAVQGFGASNLTEADSEVLARPHRVNDDHNMAISQEINAAFKRAAIGLDEAETEAEAEKDRPLYRPLERRGGVGAVFRAAASSVRHPASDAGRLGGAHPHSRLPQLIAEQRRPLTVVAPEAFTHCASPP